MNNEFNCIVALFLFVVIVLFSFLWLESNVYFEITKDDSPTIMFVEVYDKEGGVAPKIARIYFDDLGGMKKERSHLSPSWLNGIDSIYKTMLFRGVRLRLITIMK